MSRVLGDLIQGGCLAKIAHDLYIGRGSPFDVLRNWRHVLCSLSPSKTIVCPKKATLLGWVWSNGTLQASLHKLVALSSVEPPFTVLGLRSFIGAYKVFGRVLPWYTELLDPWITPRQERNHWKDLCDLTN